MREKEIEIKIKHSQTDVIKVERKLNKKFILK